MLSVRLLYWWWCDGGGGKCLRTNTRNKLETCLPPIDWTENSVRSPLHHAYTHTHTHCRCVSVQYIELVFSILTKTYWYCAVISLFVMWLSRWYYSERLLLKFVYLFLSLSFPKESQRPWQPSPSHVVWVSLTADETPLLLLLFSWNLYFGKASFYCLSGFSIFFSFPLLFFSFKNIVLFVWQIHSPPKTISCVVQFVLKFAQ